MKTNLNLKKIKTYKANQDKLRKQAVNFKYLIKYATKRSFKL